jgi:hypothetical protein
MNPTIARAGMRLALGAACVLVPFANAAAEPAKCVYSLAGTIPLRYSGPDLSLTIGGSINGAPATMLVNTASYQTFLTSTGVERHNLKLRSTGSSVSGLDDESIPVYGAMVQEFVVGPVRGGRRTMEVLEHFGFTPSYDAMLGAAFLFQADLEISLTTKELSFYTAKNCENIHLGYWEKNVAVIPFEVRSKVNLNPQFIVHINGEKMVAEISSGSSVSSIGSDAARSAGIAFDGPGAARGLDFVGLGDGKRAHWITTVATFQIGSETVHDATFSVAQRSKDEPDLTLGADFLRAYRVLVAMSQKKLYFSQSGGEPFGRARKLAPWIQAEANSGNTDAQLALAVVYEEGKLAPRDDAQAAAWLDKAVTGGNPYALLRRGHQLAIRRDYATAVTRLRAGLDLLPAERSAALTLFIARVRNGQADLAKTELAATFARTEGRKWPQPVADFYLGQLPVDALLKQAGKGPEGEPRRCSALWAVGNWHRAHGQAEAAKLRDDELKAKCSNNGRTYVDIGD